MLHRILKGIASLLLAILAFCAIALLHFTFLLTSAIEDRIYAHSLDDKRAYSRIYSELLTPDLVTDIRQEYAPELALLTSEDTVDFIRTTAPPRYVRKQTESNLRRLSMYLKGDSQQLRLYLDLSDPLEKVPIALADLIGARAAETPELLIEQARPITAQVTNHEPATDIAADLETLLTGGNPSQSLAEYTGLTQEEMITIADDVLDEILSSPEVPFEYRSALQESRVTLRDSFAHGDTRNFLEVTFGVLAQPAINGVLESIDTGLDDTQKLDLVPILARQFSGSDEPSLRRFLREWRDRGTSAVVWGRIVSLSFLAAALSLLSVVHWGNPRLMLSWAGWILTISGALLLVATLLALWQLPNALDRAIYQWLIAEQPSLSGLASLSGEVAGQALGNLFAGLVWMASIPLVIGVSLLGAVGSWRWWKNRTREQEAVATTEVSSLSAC